MEEIKDGYFWEIYDIASQKAEQDPEWNRLEMLREYAYDQAGISDDLRESVENSMDQQYLMIIWEMWKSMTPRYNGV